MRGGRTSAILLRINAMSIQWYWGKPFCTMISRVSWYHLCALVVAFACLVADPGTVDAAPVSLQDLVNGASLVQGNLRFDTFQLLDPVSIDPTQVLLEGITRGDRNG